MTRCTRRWTKRRYLRIVGLLLIHGLASCGGYDPTSVPVAPTPVPPSSPAPVAGPPRLKGTVSDSAFRLIAGAKVEVLDGPRAGDSVMTDATGAYVLVGPFTATDRIRATKEGYVPGTRTFDSSAGPFQNDSFIAFSLNVLAPPVNIAGDYTLTVVADGACAQLPDEVRTRVFSATMSRLPSSIYAPDNTAFTVALGGSDFVNGQSNFAIGVAGNDLGIWVSDPAVAERLAPNAYFALEGEARATITSSVSTFASEFAGRIEYCESTMSIGRYYSCIPGAGVTKVTCDSKTHRMIFSRQ